MAEFVKGNQLNAELEKILEKAAKQLVIVSPFIKLHSRYKDTLKSKKFNDKLEIIIVFGKNEDNISKSLDQSTFEFLKDFPNIEIRYEPNLHAKYYANESAAILSSMNLYDYSQNNNIEFGILTRVTLLGESIDKAASDFFFQVINNSKLLYQRTPVYKERMMGITKTYTHSDIKIDELSGELKPSTLDPKRGKSKRATQNFSVGYCIRTGEKIPFNPERPLSDKAYKSWSKYMDKDYKEKFCHYSGEQSGGETSFAKPIMKKNWKNVKGKWDPSVKSKSQ